MGNVRHSEARSAAIRERFALLSSLPVGAEVDFTTGGRVLRLTVQRDLRTCDPSGGEMGSSRVTIGYGPGRWNREVTPCDLLPTAPPFYGNGYELQKVQP